MKQPQAPEGNEAHTHTHENGRSHTHAPRPLNAEAVIHADAPPPPIDPPPIVPFGIDPVVAQGQGEWFTRELLGGWLALADARQIPREDFLTERCALMLMRLSTVESELRIAQTTVQALSTENEALHHQIDDCGCHDEEVAEASPK